MTARQSSARGSRYSQKNAITLHIAYEGAVDEADYFKALPQRIPKRYQGLLKIVPIEKSSTDAAPQKVRDDIFAYLKMHNLKTRELKSHNPRDIVFMVIDKDHHFNGSHARENLNAIKECEQKGIRVLCSVPCFELWLLLHYIDVASETEAFKTKLLNNQRTFSKKTLKEHRKGEPFLAMLAKTQTALKHEKKLNNLAAHPNTLVPDELVSKVGTIFDTIKENTGVEI